MYLWVYGLVCVNNHRPLGQSDPGLTPHGSWRWCDGGQGLSITWCWQGHQGVLKTKVYRRHPRMKHMWWPVTHNGIYVTQRTNWMQYWHYLAEHDESFRTRSVPAGTGAWIPLVAEPAE